MHPAQPGSHDAGTKIFPPLNNGMIALLLTILLVGLYLRCQQWSMQVLLDDEWHAVHKLLSSGYAEIARSFGIADYSIPLTIFYKALAGTVGLNEWLMRAPMLAAGMAAPIAFTFWSIRRFDSIAVAVLAWLLATSPMLVIFSRMARPYALIFLLVPCALYFAYRWWYENRSAFLFAYAATAILASYLHLLMAIIVLAPFAWFWASEVRARLGGMPGAKNWVARLIAGATLIGVPLLLLLLPPLLADFTALTAKAGQSEIDQHLFTEAGFLISGSKYAGVTALIWVLACLGGWRLFLNHSRPTGYVLFALGLFHLALFMAKPAWLQHGIVYVRYNIAFLPFFLLAVAFGIAEIARRIFASRNLQWTFASVAGIALVSGSMLIPTTFAKSSHGLHTLFTAHADPARNRAGIVIDRMVLSRFWQSQVQTITGEHETIGVAPWRFETPLSPLPVLERTSSRRVLPAFISGYCTNVRHGETAPNQTVSMRNAVYPGEHASMRAQGIAILVWQKRWMKEEDREWVMREHGPFAGSLFDRYPGCEEKIRAEFGPPVYEDEWLAAFRVNPQPDGRAAR
jgi:hypothetical protein